MRCRGDMGLSSPKAYVGLNGCIGECCVGLADSRASRTGVAVDRCLVCVTGVVGSMFSSSLTTSLCVRRGAGRALPNDHRSVGLCFLGELCILDQNSGDLRTAVLWLFISPRLANHVGELLSMDPGCIDLAYRDSLIRYEYY